MNTKKESEMSLRNFATTPALFGSVNNGDPLPTAEEIAAIVGKIVEYMSTRQGEALMCSFDCEATGKFNLRQIGCSIWAGSVLLFEFEISVVPINCEFTVENSQEVYTTADSAIQGGADTIKFFWNKTAENQQKYFEINQHSKPREDVRQFLLNLFGGVKAARKDGQMYFVARPLAYDYALVDTLFATNNPFGFGGAWSAFCLGTHLAAINNRNKYVPVDFGALLKECPHVGRDLTHGALQDSKDQYLTYLWALEKFTEK